MVVTSLSDRFNATRTSIRVALATLVVVVLGWTPQPGLSGRDGAPPVAPHRPLARPTDPHLDGTIHQAPSAPDRAG